jgi:hypothetical protein
MKLQTQRKKEKKVKNFSQTYEENNTNIELIEKTKRKRGKKEELFSGRDE